MLNDENPYRSPRAECGRFEASWDWVPSFVATSTFCMVTMGVSGNVAQIAGYDRLAWALIFSSIGCLFGHLGIVVVALLFSARSR